MFHTCSFDLFNQLSFFLIFFFFIKQPILQKNLSLNIDVTNLFRILGLFLINLLYTNPNTYLIFYLLVFLVVIFCSRLLIFNIFFLNFINSSETSRNKLITVFKDLLNSVAFGLRFSIQPIRLLLIFINGFLLTEFLSQFQFLLFSNISS